MITKRERKPTGDPRALRVLAGFSPGFYCTLQDNVT